MDKKPSALHEREGVSQQETTSAAAAEKIKLNRKKQNTVTDFVSGILAVK